MTVGGEGRRPGGSPDDALAGGALGMPTHVGWEIRRGCGNVNMVEGDAGSAACVLFCKEMSAYGV